MSPLLGSCPVTQQVGDSPPPWGKSGFPLCYIISASKIENPLPPPQSEHELHQVKFHQLISNERQKSAP